MGPHRDDVLVRLGRADARTAASRGEQRLLALALRLAVALVVQRRHGESPVLLLDDVFSELDPDRCGALLDNLPKGQTVLTTAGALPPGAVPELTVTVADATVTTS